MAAEGEFEPFTLISKAGEDMARSGITDKLAAGRDWLRHRQAGVKPWSEFLSVKNIARPSSIGEATTRVISNVRHYHGNYLFVFLGLALYTVITNPLLLFGVALWIAIFWYVSIKKKGDSISILGRSCSPAELYTFMAVVSVPVCYIAGAGSAIFWIIGVTVVVVLAHAIMMQPATATSANGTEEEGLILEDVTIN